MVIGELLGLQYTSTSVEGNITGLKESRFDLDVVIPIGADSPVSYMGARKRPIAQRLGSTLWLDQHDLQKLAQGTTMTSDTTLHPKLLRSTFEWLH